MMTYLMYTVLMLSGAFTYLMHTGLMLLGAFFAGLMLGKLIKWLFCRGKKHTVRSRSHYEEPAVFTPAMPEYDKRTARLGMTGDEMDLAEPEVRKPRLGMAETGAAVAATGTVAAGAKYAVDRLKADQSDVQANRQADNLKKVDSSGFKSSFPGMASHEVDAPSAHIDSELPRIAGLELSDFSMQTPRVDATNVELADVEDELNDTDFPAMELPLAELTEVAPDIELPKVDSANPEVDLSGIKPPEISLPELDLPEVDLSQTHLRAPNIELPEIPMPDMDIDLPEVPAVKAPDIDIDLPTVELPEVNAPDIDINLPDMDIDLPEVTAPEIELADVDLQAQGVELGGALKGAALAAGAGVAAKASGGFDAKAPEVDAPKVDLSEVDLPEVGLPEVDLPALSVPEVDISAPEVNVDLPDLKTPEVSFDAPEVDTELPEVEAPGIDLPDIETPKLETPNVDLQDKASGLGSAITGAALAAGAGVAATVSGLSDKVEAKPDRTEVDADLPNVEVNTNSLDADVSVSQPDLNAEADLPDSDVSMPDAAVTTANADISSEVAATAEDAVQSEGSIMMQHLRSAKVKPNIKLPLVTDDGVIVQETVGSASAGTSAAVEPSIASDAIETASTEVESTARAKPVTLDASELAPIIAAAAGAGVTHRLAADDGSAGDEIAAASGGSGVAAQSASQSAGGGALANADISGLVAKIRQQMQTQSSVSHARVTTLDDICQHCAGLSSLSNGGEVLVLRAGEYDRLDTIHCGVTRSGFVAVGGDVSTISDNQVVLFMMHNVAVCRNDNKHTFVIISAET